LTGTSIKEALGRRTLIMGEVGSGKTRLTGKLLEEAVSTGLQGITVLDMAPEATTLKGIPVGGTLQGATNPKVRHLKSKDIKTPRLSAGDADELFEYADHNRRMVEENLDEFMRKPTGILFVNDVSIYLQRGEINRLWRVFEAAETVVANGYYGERLKADHGTGLSSRERTLMEELASRMDVVIRLRPLRLSPILSGLEKGVSA
jgi:GTPase SAR1 family protein